MSFDAQIQTLDASSLDALFDTPIADQQQVTEPQGPTKEMGGDDDQQTGVQFAQQQQGDIPQIDLDSLDDTPPADDQPADDDQKPVEEPTEDDTQDDEPAGEDDKDSAPDPAVIGELLKNSTQYLIDKGIWQDFEGREGLEFNEEVYAELTARQAQNAAYEIVGELIDSTGNYGKAIIDHVRAGGDPDKIIDLFKEQKEAQQIDTSSDDGKQTKIANYYKEVLGWKPEKVKKYVDRLIEDDTIASEFEEVEELYNQHYQKRLESLQTKQQEQAQENLRRQQQFVNSIQEAIQGDETLTDVDRRIVADSILNLKNKLPNGQKVNDFYVKLAEIQSNPKEYIRLVRYVMDSEGYEKQLKQQVATKVKKETFSFIKGNAAIKKPATNNISINKAAPKRQQKQQGTDFSFALK